VAGQQGKMVSAALRHPIRVRVLEVLSVRDEISATGFIHSGLGKDIAELRGMEQQQQVTEVSYHLKALEKANALTQTREVKRRGGKEKFYSANAVAYFSDEEWAATSPERRSEISRVVAQGLVARIEGAMLAKTFDSRVNRWLFWDPKDLDEQGWSEMTTAFAAFHSESVHIEREAGKRLKDQGEDAEPIHTTVGLILFESPDLPFFPTLEQADAPDA
jgi:DNA-binding transcriptional ArsR family regulator